MILDEISGNQNDHENEENAVIDDLWTQLAHLQHQRKDCNDLGADGRSLSNYSSDLEFENENGKTVDEELDAEERQIEEEENRFSLPFWFRYLAWILCMFTAIFTSYWVVLYGLSFGVSVSWSWLRSCVTAVVTSIFLLQPMNVLFLAFMWALIYRRQNDRATADDEVEEEEEELEAKNIGVVEAMRRRRKLYRPRRTKRRAADLRLRRARLLQEKKMAAVFKESLVYLCFFLLLCSINFADFNAETPIYVNHVLDVFTAGQSVRMDTNTSSAIMNLQNVQSQGDWWQWLKEGVIPNLFWNQQYNSDPTNTNSYVSDGITAVVGGIQIRQLRVRNNSCPVLSSIAQLTPECRSEWSPGTNDEADFSLKLANGEVNPTGPVWNYQSPADTGMHSYFGMLNTYNGGGFIQIVPSSLDSAVSLIEEMEGGQWTDRQTRVVFVELSLYNPNIDLFAAVQLVAEFSSTTDVLTSSLVIPMHLYRYSGPNGNFLMASEIIFVLFLYYYSWIELKKFRRLLWKYFTSYDNLLNFSILFLAHFCMWFDVYRIIILSTAMNGFVDGGRSSFSSELHWVAYWDRAVRILEASCLFLATLKFLVLLRQNRVVKIMSHVLKTSMLYFKSFLLVVVLTWMAFVVFGYAAFSSTLQDYSSIPDTMYTLLLITLGSFTFSEYELANRVVGPVYFFIYALFFFIILANIFVSILNEACLQVMSDSAKNNNLGLTLADYVLDRIRWYTGLSLGQKKRSQNRRRESVGALCDEAGTKADEIFSRIDKLMNSPSRQRQDSPKIQGPPIGVRVNSLLRRNRFSSKKEFRNGPAGTGPLDVVQPGAAKNKPSNLARKLPKPNDTNVMRNFGGDITTLFQAANRQNDRVDMTGSSSNNNGNNTLSDASIVHGGHMHEEFSKIFFDNVEL